MAVESSGSLSPVQTWRTAFLSLRDEIASSPSSPSPPQLLEKLLFPHSSALLSASSALPPHEVTSDLLFLMEVATDSSSNFTQLSRLVHEICHRISLQLNSSSWTVILRCLGNLIEFFTRRALTQPLFECLSTLRCLVSGYCGKSSFLDGIQLVNLLLRIIASSHTELISLSCSTGSSNQRGFSETGKRVPQQSATLWEVQTISFTMLAETIARVGSFPDDIWKQTIEVCRKMMDVIASKSTLVEENYMSRFYEALLHFLHLVLKDPKGSMSDHVSSFLAALRMFLTYGTNRKPQLPYPVNAHMEKETSSRNPVSHLEEPKRTNNGAYRPPHLRKRDTSRSNTVASSSQSFSDHESSRQDIASSDSDYSDSDGSIRDTDSVRKSKIRVAAIECIQDLCQADPKSFTSHWMFLLPTGDALQPRKFEATLITCLLFDPYLKVRVASATTLVVMLDGPSSVFLQVAEYKEPSKFGSFTALSVSLGHILVQLHTGILYLVQQENHGRLLVSLFRILMILISSTPYSRMPPELLPAVVTSLQDRIEVGFPFKSDQTGLLSASISCLSAAFSTTPPSLHVKEMLVKETSKDSCLIEKRSNVLSTLFKFLEQASNPTVCVESLQALRAVSHNYPSIMLSYWERVSAIIYGYLKRYNTEVNARKWKAHTGNTTGVSGEKVLTANIKVLDECLRAISGFKGTEDLMDEKLQETPFTSDHTRTKRVSSAPLYETANDKDCYNEGECGLVQWSDVLEKHMPLIIQHSSPMVRVASVTCFAGITSSVFFSLAREKQELVLSYVSFAAKEDEVPSVRSAGCRAIGVISCFPQVFQSVEILDKFIRVIEINTRDPAVSVRITASWALANICDSFRQRIAVLSLEGFTDQKAISQSLELLISCSLRLSNDGEKVKSNAVRALGSLSRFIKSTSPHDLHDKVVDETGTSLKIDSQENSLSTSSQISNSRFSLNSHHLASLGDSLVLGKIVQALISCVTTGNVKVQWNVCHALSNLFLNETLRMQEMDWAPSVFSILLLLLRDSSNFKIRIQAAAALAVPSSVLDYGNSFSDVVQSLVQLVENLGSGHISAPSSFKYRVALEKQVISTLLHLLSLASSTNQEPLKDFLIKKASFLDEWIKRLCAEFPEPSVKPVDDDGKSNGENTVNEDEKSIEELKKLMIHKAIRSLAELFKGRKQCALATKFEKLGGSIS